MKKHSLIHTCTLALLATVAMGQGAFAQNINTLETRLNRMEREMQTLSRSMFKGDVPPPTIQTPMDNQALATMELRLTQMEDQIRTLTGLIEEQGYQLRKMKNSQQKPMAAQSSTPPHTNTGMDTHNDIVAETLPSAPSKPQYQLGTLKPNTSGSTAKTPASLYDEAFSYLQDNDYEEAANRFKQFTQTFPDHSLAPNAEFWLGETFYARDDYKAASQQFAKAFQAHPDSSKSPDMLLKLGLSLAKQNQKNEACLTLQELTKRFPDASTTIKGQAKDERTVLGCS